MEVEDNFEEHEREYSLECRIQETVSLEEYCGIKYRVSLRQFHRANNDLGHKVGKIEIPPFDGTTKSSAKKWVQKLDAYLQLNPMMESDAIKFANLYLEGKTHEWWYHGMTTLGHVHITYYTEFTQRLMDRFYQGDLDIHFHELTQLIKIGSVEAFIEEFSENSSDGSRRVRI
jgi:hypothetical protein